MKELLLASGNQGKIAEIRRILDGYVKRLYSAADFPDLSEVVEDGDTFEANACKKALNAAVSTGLPALADDSGLVVDALDGQPGIRSARFAGEGCGDAANNEKLLRCLEGVEACRRTASFQCVVALCFPDGSCRTFHGELNGVVLEKPRGTGGFGYDPLFLLNEFDKTLAELDVEVKNLVSHRGKALEGVRHYLSQFRRE